MLPESDTHCSSLVLNAVQRRIFRKTFAAYLLLHFFEQGERIIAVETCFVFTLTL